MEWSGTNRALSARCLRRLGTTRACARMGILVTTAIWTCGTVRRTRARMVALVWTPRRTRICSQPLALAAIVRLAGTVSSVILTLMSVLANLASTAALALSLWRNSTVRVRWVLSAICAKRTLMNASAQPGSGGKGDWFGARCLVRSGASRVRAREQRVALFVSSGRVGSYFFGWCIDVRRVSGRIVAVVV